MALLFLVITLLAVATPSYQEPMDKSEDVLVYPVAPKVSNLRKRAVQSQKSYENLEAFIEEKLVQHSQALEQLLRLSQAHDEDLKQLVENISKQMAPAKPKLPEKLEVQPSRRSGGIASTNSPRTWGDKIPQYGTLLRKLFVDDYTHDAEPAVIIEESYMPDQKQQRRAGNEQP